MFQYYMNEIFVPCYTVIEWHHLTKRLNVYVLKEYSTKYDYT